MGIPQSQKQVRKFAKEAIERFPLSAVMHIKYGEILVQNKDEEKEVRSSTRYPLLFFTPKTTTKLHNTTSI
jgi:hypothetical protein